MKKPTITTILLMIIIAVVGIYVLGEVDYYSMKTVIEENIESSTLTIEKIDLNEKINNESLSQGIYTPPESYSPDNGDVIIYGHRTLQGSPFLRLDQINEGDTLTLQWLGVGEVNYTVTNKSIVPDTYKLETKENGNRIYLITCDPIGSSENRLIIEGEKTATGTIHNEIIKDNPQKSYGLIIAVIFLVVGLGLSYFYNKDNRIYLIVTVLILSAIIFYFYFNPIDSNIIYSKIRLLNGEF